MPKGKHMRVSSRSKVGESVPQPSVSTMWEYATASGNRIEILNDFGRQGWELVTATEGQYGNTTLFFKRPVL